jgi:serine/threonine protein phosphatase PrpC
MKILSSVYWRAGQPTLINRDSLLLIEARARRGPLLLALVCDGASETATGYVAEELREWFLRQHLPIILRGKPLGWIRKSLMTALRQTEGELAAYAEKQGEQYDTSVSLLLVWAGRYLTMQSGAAGAFLCRGQAARSRAGIGTGRWRRGDSFLLCSASLASRVSERQLGGALRAKDMQSEAQMRKRLQGIGAYARQKGAYEDMAAISIIMR